MKVEQWGKAGKQFLTMLWKRRTRKRILNIMRINELIPDQKRKNYNNEVKDPTSDQINFFL